MSAKENRFFAYITNSPPAWKLRVANVAFMYEQEPHGERMKPHTFSNINTFITPNCQLFVRGNPKFEGQSSRSGCENIMPKNRTCHMS